MPKLDVKVGDEFPAEEKGQVHHHHHYYGRGPRRPFGLLRCILSVLLIIFVIRLAGFAWRMPMWMLRRDAGMPQLFVGLGGLAAAIAVIAAILWLVQRADKE
ncbi:MAG: hypothetical protein JO256_06200 [Alphaproteobacteria bacterium]|nr:hypothetical protein [Alphaproteobacteria bacterium]